MAPDALRLAHRRIFDRENPEHGMSFAEACVLAEAKYGTLGSTGSYTPPKSPGRYKGAGVGPTPTYSYSACALQADVDPETGFITIEKIWIAHDVGKAINPLLAVGQIEGSVYMGLGEALMEEQSFRLGVHKFPSLLGVQEPDVSGDAPGGDHPHRNGRPRRAFRREGVRSGPPASGHTRGS